MTSKTFKWGIELAGAGGEVKQSIASIKFGDGYEQRRSSGINPCVQIWSVQITGAAAEIAPVKAFLLDVGGLESFYWTPPNNTKIVVVVDGGGFKETPKGGGVYQLSWTFRQVFE